MDWRAAQHHSTSYGGWDGVGLKDGTATCVFCLLDIAFAASCSTHVFEV
jgi:hypothetical protein